MRRLIVMCLVFLTIISAGCTKDETVVQVIHTPLFTCNLNGTSVFVANNYSFSPVYKVVAYPQDTTLPAQVYNRFTMQAIGSDDSGNNYQLIITFDAADKNQLIGSYSPFYSKQMGLSQVQLYNLTNSNNPIAYSLCQDSLAKDVFQIRNQSQSQNLITGAFHMTICNSRDTTVKISISNGIFNNIKY